MAYQVKTFGAPRACFISMGGGGGYVPPAPDTSAVQAQRDKEAAEAATKERVRRAQTSGASSLLNKDTGYTGVNPTPLGSSSLLGSA